MKYLIRIGKNLEMDAKNWWRIVNYNFFGLSYKKQIPKKIIDKIKNKKYEKVRQFIKKEIKKNEDKNEKEFGWLKDNLLPYWKSKEKSIINRLNKIHKNKFPAKFIKIYYTSVELMFYGKEKEGFYITMKGRSKDKDLLCSAIIHELMHLYFWKYYGDVCLDKGLTWRQTEDIKEAFTILINEEFKGIVKAKDEGYEMHQKIRKFILKEWKKSKDFKKVLLATIEFI